jgi:hypothetical protein
MLIGDMIVESTAAESSNTQETTAAGSSNTQQTVTAAAPSNAQTSAPSQQSGAATGETVSAPTWTPNWKFKASGKELEVDEYFRPFIKDQDSEKRFKDVFTKAYALDGMKSQYQKQMESYNSLRSEFEPIKNSLAEVGQYLQKGDIGSFAKAFGLNDEQLFKYVEKKLEEMQLPPEQRQAMENARRIEYEKMQIEKQHQQMQQQHQQQSVEYRTLQLETVMNRPEISNYGKSWDAKMGEGSFRALVIDEASSYFHQTGIDLSPEQAITHTLKKFGGWLGAGSAPAGEATMTDSQVPGGQMEGSQVQPKMTKQGVPVIPHVTGKGASPVKKAITSMDDLMQRRSAVLARE